MADKYYRLVTFVVNICPKPLRVLFVSKAETDPDSNHHYTSIDNYLHFRKPDIEKLKRSYKISSEQFALIYPVNGSVDIKEWDVTLLIVLLKNLFPKQLQQNERNYLQDISDIRNSLQHIANIEFVTDEKFNEAWTGLRDAVLSLKQLSKSTTLDDIEDEIKSVLLDNMPALGNVRNTWQKLLHRELQMQNSKLADEVKTMKEAAIGSKRILTKAAVKSKGRLGVPEKRMKIVDQKIDRMKEKLSRSLSEENDCKEKFKNEISEISQQLADNHRVIITGLDNKLIYKCALAAIQERKNVQLDQCLEVGNPSDWKRICPNDAQIVLFREPFGVSTYDFHKVEVMCEEFDSMLQATDDENQVVIDIVIVTNQRRLNEVIRLNDDHDMLSPSSTVYINSTTDKTPDEDITPDDVVHRNLLDMSKMLRKTHELKSMDKQTKEEAKQLFLKHSMIVIVGPTGRGKTSLSFELLSSYDLSNGEDNFLVISDPGELKYVKFSLHPVIIIKFLAGGKFDHAEARKWYNQFNRLYAAVHENQIAVITTIDTKVYRRIPAIMSQHPVLQHIVRLPGSNSSGSEDSYEDTNDCGVQTDVTSLEVLPKGNNSPDDTKVDEHHLRSVIGVRDHVIEHYSPKNKCVITDAAILPSGDILLADGYNRMLLKVNDRYNVISTLNVYDYYCSVSTKVCYIGNNNAVICSLYQMMIVDVRDDMSVIRSLNISHSCYALTYHNNKLYVIDYDSAHVYSTAGEHLKVLQTEETKFLRNIAVSHDGSIIYLSTDDSKLITIDDSGKHLFTLHIPDVLNFDILRYSICLDDRGFLFILCKNWESSIEKIIIQISPDGRKCYGTLFQLENSNSNNIIKFDSNKSALVLAGESNKIKVLTLR